MQTQTIFKAGNSEVVAIPKHILKDLNLKLGQKVTVNKAPGINAVLIQKVTKEKIKPDVIGGEFKKWLADVLDEDKEILNELAVR